MNSIPDPHPWERSDWLPDGENLPTWLVELRQRHAEALEEFAKATSHVVGTAERIEADHRAWRRRVRDAVAAGQEPPQREHASEVGEATVEVAVEDAEHARHELAAVACEILNELRGHMHELDPDLFYTASPELRYALHRGPDGLLEAERARIARQRNIEAEPPMVNLDDPEHAEFVADEKEAARAA